MANHVTVHQKTKEAVASWENGNFHKAVELMTEAENASQDAFSELYQSFINHRK